MAISSFGTASDFVARFALQKIGLVPDKDVAFVQLGNPATRQAGLESNRVQATVHVPPSTFAAQKKGFNVLADVAALGLPYQHTGVATTRKFIRERPEVAPISKRMSKRCTDSRPIERAAFVCWQNIWAA